MHVRSKTLSLSYNMHLFIPYLLNDSQTICSTISSLPDKAAFVSAVLLYWGKSYFTAPKAASSGKELIKCSFRPM